MLPDPAKTVSGELLAFQQQQLAFTAHIRDPDNTNRPHDIPPQRMAIYTELIFNGLNEQLSTNFPVLRQILPTADWDDLVRGFLREHRAQTPLFTEIALEFLEYLQQPERVLPAERPFLLELAHYEYVELAVAISDADLQTIEPCDRNADLLVHCPVIAPTTWNLSYSWPVHRIGPDYLPQQPEQQPTHLVVYRDRQDAVHFLEINAVTQRLLTLIAEQPQASGLEVLQQIANELQHPEPQAVIAHGAELLNDLRQRDVIWGARSFHC